MNTIKLLAGIFTGALLLTLLFHITKAIFGDNHGGH